MTAEIIDGRSIAEELIERLCVARHSMPNQHIKLVSLEVGSSDESTIYLRNQRRVAEHVGIEFEHRQLPTDSSETSVLAEIESLNSDPSVSGILIQRPLPVEIDTRRVQSTVSPFKDVEGLSPFNVGAIMYREPMLAPCTAQAALYILRTIGVALHGAETVVVGHSEIVGKPLALLLLHEFSTVTVCHVGTRSLPEHTKSADIVIVAVGKAGLVTGAMLKPGAVVIDIGINYVDGRVCGDVEFDSAREVAGMLTPVPGGVGPVTVAMLMRNALRAAGIVNV
jgi:methylenetetrahydrofolate dehydrogenase (NADP+)/methenyltetrahydrofolate cyclohydrolase